MSLPDSDDCTVTPKPTAPIPRAPDLDLVSSMDPTLLQAVTQQVEAEAMKKPAPERGQARLRRAKADAERERQERILSIKQEKQRLEEKWLETIEEARLQKELAEKELHDQQKADETLSRELKVLVQEEMEKRLK